MVHYSSTTSKPEYRMISKPPKQTFVLITILALSLCTAISNGLHKQEYCSYSLFPVPVVGVLVLLVLTKETGRRFLFLTLFILSLVSSVIYLFELHFESFVVFSPVQGATVALIPIVICEYSNPKHRFFYLILNSAIQSFCSWVTLVSVFGQYNFDFGYCLQCCSICSGVIGLCLVFKWPESPYWLASKKRYDESARAFVAVRGWDSESSEELRALTDVRPRPASISMFYSPFLMTVPVVCISIPVYDLIYIFERMQYKFNDQTQGSIVWQLVILNCIAIMASVLSAIIPVKLSRKLLFLSCAYLFAAHLFVSIVILDTSETKPYFFAIALYTVVDCGRKIFAMPLFIEIVPQQFVSIITAIISVLYIVVEWFVCTTDIFSTLGSLISFLSLIICYFVMPEAKDKTLFQIEQLYLP